MLTVAVYRHRHKPWGLIPCGIWSGRSPMQISAIGISKFSISPILIMSSSEVQSICSVVAYDIFNSWNTYVYYTAAQKLDMLQLLGGGLFVPQTTSTECHLLKSKNVCAHVYTVCYRCLAVAVFSKIPW